MSKGTQDDKEFNNMRSSIQVPVPTAILMLVRLGGDAGT